MQGRIHSFESFGTVDGPGIRFVIFVQGCVLKCKYCHNRDTWNVDKGMLVDTDEIVKKVLREKTFIDSSNGGVTVSGGEPLLQAPFLTELFIKLKKLNIHTCIDTAGSLPVSQEIKELLKYTDLVLLDIKHIDDEKAKDLTSMSNKNNLDFAKYLNNIGKPMWIRQVLVPGYTDDKYDLQRLKAFIDTLSNVEKVEILPYHELGKYKWEELGAEYPLEGVRMPTEEDVQIAKSILEIE